MKIIAFSGKKQSGKTTASNFLEKMTGGTIIGFADSLKNIISVCFGATKEQLDGTDKQKNTPLACGMTSRALMQMIGTDVFRNDLDPDCWLRAMKHKMSRYNSKLFIIPDVRFANEVRFVQVDGGHVIRLLRAPFSDKDQHTSETALDDAPEGFFDYVLDNRGMNVEEQNMAIWEIVCERKWV